MTKTVLDAKIGVKDGILLVKKHKHILSDLELGTRMMPEKKEKSSPPPPIQGKAISICTSDTRYEIISRMAKRLGWKLVDEDDMWHVYWTDSMPSVEFCKKLKRFQKINHYPGMGEICRKDLLARNLNRMQRLFALDYNFFPKTWCFPADYGEAIQYSKRHRNKTFIIKPDQGSRGRGIWLTKNLGDIKPTDRMICQVYINNPLLVDGFKFDMRIYVLITSIDPLRIYVYNEGLARFATSKYKEPKMSNNHNTFMHLTNYSVNRHSEAFCNDDEGGSKRKLSTINRILSSEGYDTETMWRNIDDIIIKTVLSAGPILQHYYKASFHAHDVTEACFEILGIDILIDGKLRPFLLEVNHAPSFYCNEQVDIEVKEALVRDTFQIMDFRNCDKRKILKEDKMRVQGRLMRRNHKLNDNVSTTTEEDVVEEEDFWSVENTWENDHLGGFRRILPNPNLGNFYDKFLLKQNQASVYCETASSRQREIAAKQLRSDLAERFNIQNQILSNRTNFILKKKLKPNPEGSSPLKKKFKKPSQTDDDFSENNICQQEESIRTNAIEQRDFLVRSCGLLSCILYAFYRNGLLTKNDRNLYEHIYSKFDWLCKETKNPKAKETESNRIHLPAITEKTVDTHTLQICRKDIYRFSVIDEHTGSTKSIEAVTIRNVVNLVKRNI